MVHILCNLYVNSASWPDYLLQYCSNTCHFTCIVFTHVVIFPLLHNASDTLLNWYTKCVVKKENHYFLYRYKNHLSSHSESRVRTVPHIIFFSSKKMLDIVYLTAKLFQSFIKIRFIQCTTSFRINFHLFGPILKVSLME